MQDLHNAAEAVRQQLKLQAFDFHAVQELSRFIERERAGVQPDTQAAVVQALGCFLGECLVRSLGGTWQHSAAGLVGIQLGPRTFVDPFGCVQRQLVLGEADAVAVEFEAAGAARAATPAVAERAAPRRAWIPLLPVPLPRPTGLRPS